MSIRLLLDAAEDGGNLVIAISSELKGKDGVDVELSTALGTCAREFGISRQTIGRVRSAKWIGDSANHSYRVKITRGDLDECVTALRLLLAEIA